jgi:hypothetical protein
MHPLFRFMWRMYLMSGNLSGWSPKYLKKQEDGSYKIGGRKISAGVVAIVLSLFVGIGTLYNTIYPDHKPTVTDVVNTINEESEAPRMFKTEHTDETGAPVLSAAFSSDEVKVDLIVPNGPVQPYKFVKIKTTNSSSYYDLSVLTIYQNNILYVETVETSTRGEWVFTGPPGQYSIRLASFTDGVGFSAITGTVTIGGTIPPGPGPGPNPDPNPVPNVPEGKYGFGPAMYDVVAKKIPADVRVKYAPKLADNFESVAAGIAAGSWKTPTEANRELAGKNRFTFQGDDAALQAWMPFFEAWSARAADLNKAGKLPNLASEYAEVYRETQAGLKAIK